MTRMRIVALAVLLGVLLPAVGFQVLARGKGEEEHVDLYSGSGYRIEGETLTEQVLADIPDEDLEEALIWYVFEKRIGDDYEKEEEIVRALPKGLQDVFATSLLEMEIGCGGFNQYFFNSFSAYQEEAVEGYRRMGAEGQARLLMKAIAIHGEEKAMHDEVKAEGTLEAFFSSYRDTRLGRLDKPFYAAVDEMRRLRVAYIRNHPEAFLGE